jgi:hypothetical protein
MYSHGSDTGNTQYCFLKRCTEIPRYNAVHLALIRYYVAIALQLNAINFIFMCKEHSVAY